MEKKIEFKSGNEILRGSLFTPSGKGQFPGVVFFHGRGSDRTRYLPMAKFLSDKGIITLAFDFGGCGESTGVFANQTHRMGVEDGRAALEFLLSQNVDKARIGIQGTSFGGYVTGMLLNDYDFIKSVALRVPASYADEQLDTIVIASDEKDFFSKKENWINASSYKGIGKFTGSLLVIKSKNDEIVSSEAVDKYFNDAKKVKNKKLIIQNAKHSFRDDPKGLEEFYRYAQNWFLETL
ncbi:MAG: prolyl oligopeptidase family serine peptidase [bacterium]|nr:prolyl oligopeptidase family serine peptidase [bacterium]